MDRVYFSCAKCFNDRFANERRLFFLAMADGTLQRNWSTDAGDSTHIICTTCAAKYVWNSTLHVYERVHATAAVEEPT